MSEFLDFKAISAAIPFKSVLDHFNILYDETDKELRTEEIVVSKEKNLFFSYKGTARGSVINFYANREGMDVRRAALELKRLFIDKPPEKEIPEYELDYSKVPGIPEEVAKEYEAGKSLSKGISAGRIVFKIYDQDSNKVAYTLYRPPDDWFYFKGYEHKHLYNFHRVKDTFLFLTVSPLDVLHLISLGMYKTIGLLHPGMTEAQETLLKGLQGIYLLHPEPENIVKRLSSHIFIKAPKLNKKVLELTKEDIAAL